ncbi:MAG TPA: helix-turn-helix domain-containing protein, partial [Rhodocyclaceae bacterium]|nr:helix-turn-helix domain-containing protein [Rhodocyclaceae bacterium]
AYAWPGNVRELSNALEYALVHAEGDVLLPRHLPPEVRQAAAARPTAETVPGLVQRYYRPPADMAADEKTLLAAALRESAGNRAAAARRLGMSRTTLWKKLKQYGLEG